MKVLTILSTLVKSKILVTTSIGVALVTGTGIAAAATPFGQDLVQHVTGAHATVTPTHEADDTENDGKAMSTANANGQGQKGDPSSCPGQPEAQKVASDLSLSTDSGSNSMQVICTLHDGTFQGTVDGNSVTTDHALGYGEIGQLLTYAQSLAKENNDTLTDSNVLNYVSMALHHCGSTAVAVCVNANVPADTSDNTGDGHDMNDGKPAATPTPHADEKPTSTPTPHASK
jgi:hypothetical protein